MPGFNVITRTPRAYNSPASSAICELRGISRPVATPLGLGEHLPGPRDPQPELLRSQVHPAARRRLARIGADAPAGADDHRAAAVHPLAVGRQDGDAD